MATTLDAATLAGSGGTLSGGNLSFQNVGGNAANVRSSFFLAAAKFYFETKWTGRSPNTSGYGGVGVVQQSQALVAPTSGATIPAGMWILRDDGFPFNNGGNIAVLSSIAINDIIMVACDPGAGRLWWGKNGTWLAGSPSAGTGASYTNLTGSMGALLLAMGNAIGSAWTINFGDTAYSYTPPTGFGQLAPAAGWAYGQVIG